jgi:hypothetical protein
LGGVAVDALDEEGPTSLSSTCPNRIKKESEWPCLMDAIFCKLAKRSILSTYKIKALPPKFISVTYLHIALEENYLVRLMYS